MRRAAATDWIETLELVSHPEGGWFREVYRSDEAIARAALPARFTGDRPYGTAIYFLLQGTEFSALHAIQQDEVWHFYDGGPLTLHMIGPDRRYSVCRLGRAIQDGQRPMAVVRSGWLFGATVEPDAYALVGCTVAPGFDFDDFDMPTRAELLARYPEHREIVERLTRE